MNIVKNRALEALTKQLIKDCGAALAVPCQRHGCMWDAPEAHEECRAEQREASAGLIYGLAHSMTARGLFVRDDFGEPDIHAIHEIEAAIRSGR